MKRALDVVLAAAALVLAMPVMLGIAACIAVVMGRPVLFRQVRPGLCGQPFTLVKFRTMRPATHPDHALDDDEERLTRFGRYLRETSMDELPSLWNVIRGDMSLVGPRPLLVEYLNRYSAEQARRHEVRPGLTGWAQINGRNSIGWKQRLDMDIWYVDHRTMWLDLRILARTIVKVIRREGISEPGRLTATPFRGSDGDRTRSGDRQIL